MILRMEQQKAKIFIKHYESGKKIIFASKKQYINSIIITYKTVINDNWLINDINKIHINTLDCLLDLNVDVHILGTGEKSHIPSNNILKKFELLGKSLDFMNSHAACSTFNILANDSRKVAAAIIL